MTIAPWGLRLFVLICGTLFSVALLDYVGREYSPFVTHGAIESILLPSWIRLTCRVGYVVGFAGMWKQQRWGVVLVLLAWLGQAIPSAIINRTGGPFALVFNNLDLVVFVAVIWLYRHAFFQPGPVLRPIATYLAAVAALHLGLVWALRSLMA